MNYSKTSTNRLESGYEMTRDVHERSLVRIVLHLSVCSNFNNKDGFQALNVCKNCVSYLHVWIYSSSVINNSYTLKH